MYTTRLSVPFEHRFTAGDLIADPDGGKWEVRQLLWREQTLMYRLTPRDHATRLAAFRTWVRPEHEWPITAGRSVEELAAAPEDEVEAPDQLKPVVEVDSTFV